MSRFPSLPTLRARFLLLFLAIGIAGCDPFALASFFDGKPAGTSVLTLLDTDDRKLDIGDDVQGALSASDYIGADGSYLEAWALKARAGEKIWIDLVSDDFDSYLYIVGPGLAETLRDDDSGGACHARLELSVLESGTFHVVASASGSQTGTYRLSVTDTPGPAVAISCGGLDGASLTALATADRRLRMGSSVSGFLGAGEASIQDGRPVQAWTLEGVAGERATIRLGSADYDSYLYFFGPGLQETMTNDDGGAGLDSELTVTFPATGTYTVGASALSSGSTGSYTLTVSPPIDPASLSTASRSLRIGSVESGQLTDDDAVIDGRLVQAWAFVARSGDVVTFELESDDFDSYLRVIGDGLGEGLADDDSGGDLDSRLQVTFPRDGTYRVLASSLGGSAGGFTLRAR